MTGPVGAWAPPVGASVISIWSGGEASSVLSAISLAVLRFEHFGQHPIQDARLQTHRSPYASRARYSLNP